MWEDLPKEFAARRPRPALVHDGSELGYFNAGWLIDGRMEPHALGPGLQPATPPRWVVEGPDRGSLTLVDPEARIRDLDRLGIDVQFLFPSTLYARWTSDPRFEAALCRAFNRFIARQTKPHARRLKWAGLIPLREPRESIAALDEMIQLGASAAVVFGTAHDKMLCDSAFTDFWDEFARCKLPLCVHMAASFPPFDSCVETFLGAHAISMALPAQMAFVALLATGMMDRYPELRIAFMEFGAEWIFYMVGRLDHYLARDREIQPQVLNARMPAQSMKEYLRSGRVFICGEMGDPLMRQEIELLGEGQLLYSSDYPHGEGRENAAQELIERSDVTDAQKQKILFDNPLRLFGEI
ncbi:MAG TPA: amidohydrolase family protein [Candidatus Limnocylindria bacterium]|nr:amidohydrolase family protein [Candidatus Limnocylindria bacterium]